jgi:cell division protein FtsB
MKETMPDIVERLRDLEREIQLSVLDEAADEIERLHKERDGLAHLVHDLQERLASKALTGRLSGKE